MTATSSATAACAPEQDQITVMVVDDSVVIRGLISRWISEAEGLQVVAKHRNGENAVNDLLKSDPDVVVLDIEMPVMDGMTALPEMLRLKPDLIVIMASTLTTRNAEISLQSMQLGAKDYIPKPSGNHGISTSMEFRRELIDKIAALSGKIRRKRAPGDARRAPVRSPTPRGTVLVPEVPDAKQPIITIPLKPGRPKILAVGSSTGGPNVLRKLMHELAPAINDIPVVITQHMPATFTAILAGHIQKETGRTAREGEHREVLKPGQIYIAPGGKHMLIKSGPNGPEISLNDGPQINFCKPAVDPMFKSLIDVYGSAILSVVLTGMGSDGASGAVEISKAGGNVIAQDEETSVVWGMPGATAAAGVCMAVLPVDQIARRVTEVIGGRG